MNMSKYIVKPAGSINLNIIECKSHNSTRSIGYPRDINLNIIECKSLLPRG